MVVIPASPTGDDALALLRAQRAGGNSSGSGPAMRTRSASTNVPQYLLAAKLTKEKLKTLLTT